MVSSAFSFDGTNSYVQITNSAVLQPTNFTVECWVRFTSLDSPGLGGSPAGDQYIVFKQNTRTANFEGFDLDKTRTASGDVFRLIVSSSAGVSAFIQSSTLISTGVWYHVAALRGSNFIQLYVNGQLERQTNVAFAQNYGNFPLYFGSTGQAIWDHKLKGNLDEVSLYNRALSPNEIAGVYAAGVAGKCKAVNITTQPQNQAVNIGSNATFTVGASGFGNLVYRWQFNATNIVGASNTSLVLVNVQATNAGNYQVVVTNLLSSVTSAVAVLTVNVPPFVTVVPTNQTVLTGANVNFSVSAGGTAPLNYQWRKGGGVLLGQTNTSLSLTGVTTNDAGSYDVIVGNIAGSTTSSPPVVLTVNMLPFITVAPTNQSVLAGANVNFNVSAGGTAPLNYQWRKGGGALLGQINTSLSLTSVTTNDAGSYDVVISNVAGSVTSTPPAMLTVNVPPFITVGPTNQTVLTGASVNFSVSAGGTSPLNYQWRKSGGVIANQTNTTLSLTGVTTNDAESYTVVVSNVAGSTTSSPPAVLTVNVLPFITVAPTNQSVLAGANTNFNLSAGGTAPLNYQWRKNGGVLPGQTNTSLPLSNVATNDAGSYDVVVSNIAGSTTSSPPAVLTVNVLPFITVAPTNQSVLAGGNVSFNVSTGGTAPLNYQWRKSGGALPGQTNTSLSLTGVTTNDAGSYDVVISNIAGSTTSSPPAVLTILPPANTPPFVLTPPQSVSILIGASASLSVDAGGTQPLTYQWRKNGLPLSGETSASLQLIAITTNNAGNYDVVITNAAGTVTSTPPATLAVVPTIDVPPFITTSPSSQVIGLGSGLALTVTAGGTAPLNYQWRKNGLPIPEETGPGLILPNVTTNDTGLYDAVVGNTAGSATSAVASVVVRLIVDPQLETAIRCALAKQTGNLATTDIATLTNLFIRNRGVTNLFSLQYATQLVALDASQNAIDDISPLQGLTQLRSLELDQNRGDIETLVPLSRLTNLTSLVLGGVYATDYTPLTNLTSLLRLTYRQGSVASLPPLQALPRLTYLDLTENNITNLTPLAALTNLDHLDLRWNLLTNQNSQWTGPTNLSNLYLGGNHLGNAPALQTLRRLTLLNLEAAGIKNLSPLAGLSNLTYLSLSRNPITNYTVLTGLTNLTSLELSGNNIGSASFLTSLSRLRYADLSYNTITNLTPLSGLNNLTSIVLAGNPQLNYSPLTAMPGVRHIWLHNNHITNATFLASPAYAGVQHLNLDDNQLADLTPLLTLTNLTGLGLSRNPLTNTAALAASTQLTSLRLDGNTIADATFLQNLTQMKFLSLNQNQLTEIYTLDTLTNLQSLYLKQNRISDAQPLLSYPRLAVADLSLNLIPQDQNQESMVQSLQCQMGNAESGNLESTNPISTFYFPPSTLTWLPQRQPPRIAAPATWFIPVNTSATLEFNVADDVLPFDPLPVTADFSEPELIANNNLLFTGTNGNRTLTITPQPDQSGNTTLTLTVMNDAGLTSNATVQVSVMIPVEVTSNMLPPDITNLDAQFETAIRLASGKLTGELTSVDLLNVTTLNAVDANLSNFTGWQWLTNLSSLNVGGIAVTNLDFLTHLPQLTTLTLRDAAITNFDAVASLTRLTRLTITGTLLADITPLAGLTNLNHLDLQHNRLANIQTLVNPALAGLAFVDMRYNLLDTSGGSVAAAVLQNLTTRAIALNHLPQRKPPTLKIGNNWNISANRSSWLFFQVTEGGQLPAGPVTLHATPANPALLPVPGLAVGQDINAEDWFVSVTPASNQTGNTTITLAATNDVGFITSTTLVVTVVSPLALEHALLGTPNLVWQTSGNAPWFGHESDADGGLEIAQSGSAGNFGISTLETSVIGPGTLSFWWKVSSETNYDWLVFESAAVTNQISGEVDWQEQIVDLKPEQQTLRWRYQKDQNTVEGMDAAWLAQVSYEPRAWLKLPPTTGNGQLQMLLYGMTGQNYEIQISTNLIHWTVLTNITSTNSIMPFVDVTLNVERRFYRARAIP